MSIAEILMTRDGNTEQEAISRMNEVRDLMDECNYEPIECEELLMDYLGLEPDYLPELLYL